MAIVSGFHESLGELPTPFPREEFERRREALFDAIGSDALALLQGAPAVRGFLPFRQRNDFSYLCGIDVPHAYLLLNGRRHTTTLYLPHRDERTEASEGKSLSAEDADEVRALSGVDAVAGPERLAQDLAWALFYGKPPALFLPLTPADSPGATRDTLLAGTAHAAADPWDRTVSPESQLAQAVTSQFPQLSVEDLAPLTDRLRLVKSPAEVARMREAGRLCGLGIMEAMRSTAPGVMEYQLEAVADFVFRIGGADGAGYRAIVAGGRNIWNMHYSANNRPLMDGDLVLMDYAPNYGGYTSDIGRMWPVNGRYSDQQRELYGFMVEYHNQVLARIRPGVRPQRVMEEAAGTMQAVLERTQFSKPIYAQAARRTLQFKGHLSHPVGMAVHDVGDYTRDPLIPGLVFSVDPQMWIPEEQLYIRVEDTVVVTDTGIENLTGFVPADPPAIEALMPEPGLLQR